MKRGAFQEILYLFLILLSYMAAGSVFGLLSTSIAKAKGYTSRRKFFLIGVFLWFIGLMYAGFMPEEESYSIEKMRKALSNASTPSQPMEPTYSNGNDQNYYAQTRRRRSYE